MGGAGTIPNACCSGSNNGIQNTHGIVCTGTFVTQILWNRKGLLGSIAASLGSLTNLNVLSLGNNHLSGAIPSEIGNLINLQKLYLHSNKFSGSIPEWFGNMKNLESLELFNNTLSGSIPASIGNLTKLRGLYVHSNNISGSIPQEIGNSASLSVLYLAFGSDLNPNLNGTLTPRCGITVYAANTNITLCGCATVGAPPILFPAPGTSPKCLATGVASPLIKRTQVFTQALLGLTYTCNKDSMGNPFQDCLNTMGVLCDKTEITGKSTRILTCKTAINSMFSNMGPLWRTVLSSCAPWKGGLSKSSACSTANNNLIAGAYYNSPEGQIKINAHLTESIKQGLWENLSLQG